MKPAAAQIYVRLDSIAHIRDRIVAARSSPKRSVKVQSAPIPESKNSHPKPMVRTRSKVIAQRFDVFISHASEDKIPFVRNLANRIRKAGISVWYDEFSLKWGDRLRASIDKGLLECRYGIVVLSPDFFRKDWPQDELEGLFALEGNGETKVLPIWYNLDRKQVAQFSPMLAGRLAVSSDVPVDEIIEKLIERLRQ